MRFGADVLKELFLIRGIRPKAVIANERGGFLQGNLNQTGWNRGDCRLCNLMETVILFILAQLFLVPEQFPYQAMIITGGGKMFRGLREDMQTVLKEILPPKPSWKSCYVIPAFML